MCFSSLCATKNFEFSLLFGFTMGTRRMESCQLSVTRRVSPPGIIFRAHSHANLLLSQRDRETYSNMNEPCFIASRVHTFGNGPRYARQHFGSLSPAMSGWQSTRNSRSLYAQDNCVFITVDRDKGSGNHLSEKDGTVWALAAVLWQPPALASEKQ